jgi:hypothetical protein
MLITAVSSVSIHLDISDCGCGRVVMNRRSLLWFESSFARKGQISRARVVARLVLIGALSHSTGLSFSQSLPTATQRLQLSTFVASSRVSNDVAGDKEIDLTSGLDLSLPVVKGIRPSIEARGSYPLGGMVARQKVFLAGPGVGYDTGRLHYYMNVIVGRGRINYEDNGYIFRGFRYITSTSMVSAYVTGIDIGLTHQLSARVDFQYQHWTAPTPSFGSVNPVILSLGGVYKFDFNTHHRGRSNGLN